MRFKSRPMVYSRTRHHWRPLTWGQMLTRVEGVALGLVERGIMLGDRAALVADSCIEWVIADQACAAIGVPTVAMSTSYADPEINFILQDAKPRVMFVNKAEVLTQDLMKKLVEFGVELAVTLQTRPPADPPEGLMVMSLFQLEALGDSSDQSVDTYRAQIIADDLLTIIYTSGTTGEPKGVMLSHRNVISNCEAASRAIAVGPDDVLLSFLPLGHSFERIAGYYLPCLFAGAAIYYSAGVHRLLTDIQEVRPTIITGVPRLLESILARIMVKHRTRALPMRALLSASFHLSTQVKRMEDTKLPWLQGLGRSNRSLIKVLLSPVRRLLGDRLRFIISGGASLGKEAAEFFFAAGILVLEGYGLTEAAPIVSVNRPGAYAFGTVGRPLDNVRLRLTEEGEILVKGPNVMLGYHGDQEGGGAYLAPDGWLHTGDLGFLTRDGYLTITDRKKNLFKDRAGRYISPVKIEALLKQSPDVEYAIVIGEGRAYPSVLLFLDPKIVGPLPDKDVNRSIGRLLARVNRKLPKHERVRAHQVIRAPLTQESGLLTSTFKPKRAQICLAFNREIDEMYLAGRYFSRGNRGESVARR
jgi:long-chain acyl-CoA synthetase